MDLEVRIFDFFSVLLILLQSLSDHLGISKASLWTRSVEGKDDESLNKFKKLSMVEDFKFLGAFYHLPPKTLLATVSN